SASAQRIPELGYTYPPGGRAGTTIEVRLGGYDWTPDMQFFVLDRRGELGASGAPRRLLVAPPPPTLGCHRKRPPPPPPRGATARRRGGWSQKGGPRPCRYRGKSRRG